MEDIYKIAANGGISDAELKDALKASLEGRTLQKVLIIPPDFTRFHSQAGKITSIYYQLLTEQGAQVDAELGGVFRITEHLQRDFGADRVIASTDCRSNTPS